MLSPYLSPLPPLKSRSLHELPTNAPVGPPLREPNHAFSEEAGFRSGNAWSEPLSG
jgi:hypothetical protein